MIEIKKPESCSHCSKIVQIGNPILRKPATKVENNSVKSVQAQFSSQFSLNSVQAN